MEHVLPPPHCAMFSHAPSFSNNPHADRSSGPIAFPFASLYVLSIPIPHLACIAPVWQLFRCCLNTTLLYLLPVSEVAPSHHFGIFEEAVLLYIHGVVGIQVLLFIVLRPCYAFPSDVFPTCIL